MRWVVLVARFLFVIGISLLVVAAPQKPGWQFVAGFFYPLRLLIVLNLLNSPLDIIDMVLYNRMTGPEGSPLTARSVLGRGVSIVTFWFVLLALSILLGIVFFIDFTRSSTGDLEDPANVWYFLAGTFVGPVTYLASVSSYRKSMRRRYGY